MSVAAVMLVRDEADVIGATVEHLREHVDAVYVLDNRSSDGTTVILHDLADEWDDLVVTADPEVGYWQSRKTTGLAQWAREDGHQWVVPVDADELWLAPGGFTIRDWLSGIAPDVQVVQAELLNHVPTRADGEGHPFASLTWRLRMPGALPKVAARTHPHLTIHAGNHGADYGRIRATVGHGLRLHHFSWRGEDAYVRKIRNGEEAYAATSLPETIGQHWRVWADKPDDAIREWYRTWFTIDDPGVRDDLVDDPLVVGPDGRWRPSHD